MCVKVTGVNEVNEVGYGWSGVINYFSTICV